MTIVTKQSLPSMACSASISTSTSTPISKANPLLITDQIQQTVSNCFGRSNSCIENKYKCTITSERLSELKKLVDGAIKDHKVFTIRGCWPVIRRELLHRKWVEKAEPVGRQKATHFSQNSEELLTNFPAKQDSESPSAYAEHCERIVMSRMLQSYDADLYWSMRKDQIDMQHRGSSYQIISRFCRSLFASKEGLALLLQHANWFIEPNVSSINFPRCYVLGFPDHFSCFMQDFRNTACAGLLKWYVHKYEKEDKHAIQSPEGYVPYTALQFALDRCSDYIINERNMDLDQEDKKIWDHEWEQFCTHYSMIMYQNLLFEEHKKVSVLKMYNSCKSILNELKHIRPDTELDGMKNIWILKPGNKCRGRGIQLIKDISEVEKIMNLKLKYVVQKYIERPLTIYETKFDIRQWFMVTNAQPLTIWMYRECYLRFSSQVFNLDNFHESLHLTNYSIQCKYTNTEKRDKALPTDNMWDCNTFKRYLSDIGYPDVWDNVIYPGMRQGITCAMLCSQETMDRRQNTFEIYGADFMLSEDFRPWLLEINCCPDMSSSTSVTRRMCPKCMEDVVKVVVDRRRDIKASTGGFDLVFKQNLPRTPAYLGVNLSVRGRRLFKGRKKPRFIENEKENVVSNIHDPETHKHRHDKTKFEMLSRNDILITIPKILSPDLYKGPIIQDLMEDIQMSFGKIQDEDGVNFVPAPVQSVTKTDGKKKKEMKKDRKRECKKERVLKREIYSSNKSKINRSNSFYRKRDNQSVTSENSKSNLEAKYKYKSRSDMRKISQSSPSDKIKLECNNSITVTKNINLIWNKKLLSILKCKNVGENLDNLELSNKSSSYRTNLTTFSRNEAEKKNDYSKPKCKSSK